MDMTLVLGLLKIGLEIFKDERKGRFLKKYLKLEAEYQSEINKPDSERSDLKLDRLCFEAEQLAKLVILESGKP